MSCRDKNGIVRGLDWKLLQGHFGLIEAKKIKLDKVCESLNKMKNYDII